MRTRPKNSSLGTLEKLSAIATKPASRMMFPLRFKVLEVRSVLQRLCQGRGPPASNPMARKVEVE
jgi:hypothetical protein